MSWLLTMGRWIYTIHHCIHPGLLRNSVMEMSGKPTQVTILLVKNVQTITEIMAVIEYHSLARTTLLTYWCSTSEAVQSRRDNWLGYINIFLRRVIAVCYWKYMNKLNSTRCLINLFKIYTFVNASLQFCLSFYSELLPEVTNNWINQLNQVLVVNFFLW